MEQYNGQVNFTYSNEMERKKIIGILNSFGYQSKNAEEDYASARAHAICADRKTKTHFLIATASCAALASSGKPFHHADDAENALNECDQEWKKRHVRRKKQQIQMKSD